MTEYTSTNGTVGYCCAISSAVAPVANASTMVSSVTLVPATRTTPWASVWMGTRSSTFVAFMAEILSELYAALSPWSAAFWASSPIDNRVDIGPGAACLRQAIAADVGSEAKPAGPHVPQLAQLHDIAPGTRARTGGALSRRRLQSSQRIGA